MRIVGSETILISLVRKLEVEQFTKLCWKAKKIQTEIDGLRQTRDKVF